MALVQNTYEHTARLLRAFLDAHPDFEADPALMTGSWEERTAWFTPRGVVVFVEWGVAQGVLPPTALVDVYARFSTGRLIPAHPPGR